MSEPTNPSVAEEVALLLREVDIIARRTKHGIKDYPVCLTPFSDKGRKILLEFLSSEIKSADWRKPKCNCQNCWIFVDSISYQKDWWWHNRGLIVTEGTPCDK